MTDQPAKRALIVDDSKSARGFLARILEKHGIEVDTAENAEQAIDYLAHTQPDVIFMDHLMPGMDGFQAVQSIKNNPRTATIPIMMYTSQEGELYLGQARALGAVGVLPKQVKPAEVSTVLYQLRVLPDRRRNGPSGFQPGNVAAERALVGAAPPAAGSGGATAASTESAGGAEGLRADATGTHPAVATAAQDGELAAGASAALAAGASATGEPLRPLVEDAVRAQLTEFRRAIAAYLDQNSDRLLADVRSSVAEVLADASAALRRRRARHRSRPGGSPPAHPCSRRSSPCSGCRRRGRRRISPRNSSRCAPRARSSPRSRRPPAACRSLRAPRLRRPPRRSLHRPRCCRRQTGGRERARDRHAGALWRDPGQRRAPRVAAPAARGAAGRRFPRPRHGDLLPRPLLPQRHADRGLRARRGGTAADKCDLVGNPFDDNLAPAQREPVALANLIGALRQRSGGGLQVELAAGAETVHASAYPGPSPTLRASEWNRAAEGNNRLEIRIQPDAT
ncbi:MAG: response regulator [Steroidobacteraceae bacterium]